jgi:hypothetical protein
MGRSAVNEPPTLFYVRCLHVDYDREPDGPEQAGEEHWRCRARFLFEPELPSIRRDYCPQHRALYGTSTFPVMPEEMRQTVERVEQLSVDLGETFAMPKGA